MENPFAHLIPAQQGTTPPPAPEGDPYTVGIPRPRQPSPQTPVQAETDAENLERVRLANEAARVQAAAGAAAQAAESERKAAAFFTRAFGSNRAYERTGVGPRSLVGQGVADTFPNALNSLPSAIGNSPARQVADSAQNEFIAASLRQDSGAAIPEQEMERQRRIYFPMPGDGPEAIEQKRQARIRALEGLTNSAGRSLRPEDRAAYDEWRATLSGAPAGAGPAEGGEQFASQLETALRAGQFTTPDEMFAFVERINPTIASRLNAETREEMTETLARFNEARSRGRNPGIVVDVPTDPAVDISGVRGDGADPRAMMVNEGLRNADPMFGPLFRAATGLLGQEGGDAFARGFRDVATLGMADEVGGTIRAAVTSGSVDDEIARERAINTYDEENNFGARVTGQISGGFALPFGGAGNVGRLIAAGAGYGGAYGFGSGEGGTDRLIRAGEGTLVGGGLAGGLGMVGTGIARLGRGGGGGRRADAQALVEAAGRQNVDLMPADVGGPMLGRLTAAGAQLPFSSGPVMRGARRVNTQTGDRLADVASAEGAPLRQEQFGEAARNAAEGYIERSGAEGRRLYDSARSGAEGATATADRAISALDSHITELSSTASTSAPEISALQRLRSDLAGEGGPQSLDIDSLRRLRTNVRAMAMEEGLRGSDFGRRAGQVLSSLSEDVAQSLPADARAAFVSADRHWAERLNVIDDVMSNILGPRDNRSAEQVAQRLISMSRGDSGRLRTFIDNVTPEEAGVVRASLIQELGRASSGQQGAEGANFSLSSFLTNWDRLPERSRNLLFRGESRAAINDLATIAEGARESAKYANTSNTAGAVSSSQLLHSASLISAWGTSGVTAIVENLTGRLLASPRFARWLGRPPQDRGRALRRLAQIASREPQLAPDILPIQRALETTVPRAAAEQEDDSR